MFILVLIPAFGPEGLAQEESGTLSVSLYEKGVDLMEEGAFDQALPVLEQAIEKDPQNASATYAIAVCHARKKEPNTKEARKWHQEAMALGHEYSEWLDRYCNQLDKQQ